MYSLGTRVRKDRLNKRGETKILIVIYSGKRNKEMSSGISILPDDWDAIKGRVKSTDPSYRLKNSILNKKIAKAENDISEALAINPNIELKDIFTKREKRLGAVRLVDYLEEYIGQEEVLKEGTMVYYVTTLNRIKEYKSEVLLSEIDDKYLQGFEKWLKTTYNNKQNTVWNRLKVIRKICHKARREGLIDRNPFEFYKLKTEETERDFLTLEELKAFMNLTNLTALQERVRDIYIFCSFSGGIRFSDVATLTWDDIKVRNDIYRLRIQMTKTEKFIEFKLPKLSVDLLKKYRGGNTPYCFPILPAQCNAVRLWTSRKNALFNKTLKVIAKKSGILKHITFHTSRHTFATLSLSNGIQTEIVGEILGHKDLKTTQIYTKILDKQKDDAMDKFDELLG